jgi:multiple sugar transport system permease protein
MRYRRKIKELSNLQFALVLTLPVLIFLIVVIIYPLLYALWASFHKIIFFGGYRTQFVGFQNYAAALKSPDFWNGLKVSLRFTVESVVLTMIIGLGISLTLARAFPGKRLIRSLVILPWAVSRYGAGIMFKYLWRGYTSLGSSLSFLMGFEARVDLFSEKTVIEALAIGNAWNLAPLVAFFLLANIETIPERLYDMAEVDNLGPFGRFYYVTLPYLRYTLFVFTAIVAVLSLKVFDYIFTQTGGGPGTASATLTYQIYKESFKNLNLGYGAALSFYLLILILALTFTLYLVWGRKEA